MERWALGQYRYHGTDIDGVILESGSLNVRGRDLNSLVGEMDFVAAILHLLEGEPPSQERRDLLDRFMTACLRDGAAESPLQVVAAATSAGAPAPAAVAAGMACSTTSALAQAGTALARATGLARDLRVGLAVLAQIPRLYGCAVHGCDLAPNRTEGGWTGSALAHVLRRGPSATEVRVFDALLVAWHAGFGYITPTVMVPRISIGTRVSIPVAMSAGFLASGPSHTGAAEDAMVWLRDAVERRHRAKTLRTTVSEALRTIREDECKIAGFGHPLFLKDPRPLHLRRVIADLGLRGDALEVYDDAIEYVREAFNLEPNIDLLSAAAYLALGVQEPAWGSGIGLIGRSASMLAHVIERQSRPPFGVSSKTARLFLHRIPTGWI